MDPTDDGYQMGCGGGDESGPTDASILRKQVLSQATPSSSGQPETSESSTKTQKPQCSHCKSQPSAIFVRLEPICRECFLDSLQTKGRRQLTFSADITSGERIVIGYSGGASSRALIQVIQNCAFRQGKGKLFVDAVVTFVDTSSILSLWEPHFSANQAKAEIMNMIIDLLSKTNFHAAIVPLESLWMTNPEYYYVSSEKDLANCVIGSSLWYDTAESDRIQASKKLNNLLGSFKGLDAKGDIVKGLIRRCLRVLGKTLGIGKVLLGDNSLTVARYVLDLTVKGRGYSLLSEISDRDFRHAPSSAKNIAQDSVSTDINSLIMSVQDSRSLMSLLRRCINRQVPVQSNAHKDGGLTATEEGELIFTRPFSSFEPKELYFYCRWHKLHIGFVPTFETKCEPRSSLTQACESLIQQLQAAFPGTVHNVMKTASKLEPPPETPATPRASHGVRQAHTKAVSTVFGELKGGKQESLLTEENADFHPRQSLNVVPDQRSVLCSICGGFKEHQRFAEDGDALSSTVCNGCCIMLREFMEKTSDPKELDLHRELADFPDTVKHDTLLNYEDELIEEMYRTSLQSSEEMRERVKEFILDDS